MTSGGNEVVSSGHSRAFYVVFVPLKYILSMPPHSTYVIVVHDFLEWITIELHLQGEQCKQRLG